MYEIDEQQIRLWWSVFNPDSKLVEIRLLGKSTYSGYFKDVDTLIRNIKPLLDHNNFQYYGAMQAYFTLNEISEDLYGREQHDKFVKQAKTQTTDGNVVRRRFVLIDLDPNRVAGVSSSDIELEKAHMKAIDVYKYLIEQGFREPIISISGNGYHLTIPCDMPSDDEHTDITKRFLESLAKMFSDENVEIDRKVFNLSRIDKLIGTWAKKGSDSEDRKWRLARILKVPSDLSPNDTSLFKKIADLVPKEEPAKPTTNKQSYFNDNKFDLESWLNTHGVEYKKSQEGGSLKYVIKKCPWEDLHSTKNPYSSVIFQDADGKMVYSCAHSHCIDKKWSDFRTFYEPDAYTKKNESYENVRGYRRPTKPKFEIKEELPELGKKWLCMKDIKKVDISDMTFIPTGYNSIDMLINGFCLGQVSIMSGKNSAGKTSFLNSIAMNAVDADYKTAIWSREIPSYLMNTWLQMVAAGKEYMKPSKKPGFYYVPNDIADKINEWTDGKLFVYNNEYPSQWEQLLNDIKILIKAGVKLFILDNLFSMNIDIFEGDSNEKQRSLIMEICNLAKAEMVHIILVAHPRKATTFLRKEDIKGNGVLSDAVDNIFIIHRVNNDFMKAGGEFFGNSLIQEFSMYGNVIEIAKDRLFGKMGHLCGLFFDEISKRFLNTETENRRYGWIEEPHQIEINPEQASISDGITNNTSFDSSYTQNSTNYSQSEENDYSDNNNNVTDDNYGLPY